MAEGHIYVSRFSMLISPAPRICINDFCAHIPSVTYMGLVNVSRIPSAPDSRRSLATLISLAMHICCASLAPIATHVV